MAKLICIYWRDIPAQVVGREGRKNVKKVLAPRFAEAIDRAVGEGVHLGWSDDEMRALFDERTEHICGKHREDTA